MSTAVTIQGVQEPKSFLSQEKIQLIKELYCKKASNTELQLFLEVCESRRLDPVLKQIHAVFRWSSKDQRNIMSIQVGIDGFRSLAARTGEYAGSDAAIFEFEKDNGYPTKATVTVYRIVKGIRCAFTGEAYWDEYAPDMSKPEGFFWKKMPMGQLAKCAETIALRKAFPSESSGLYEPAEMNQAGFKEPESLGAGPKPLAPAPATVEMLDKLTTAATIDRYNLSSPAPASSSDLGEALIPSGMYKGHKFKDVDREDLGAYALSVKKKLANPEFPAEMKADAEQVVGLCEIYLGLSK